MAIEVRESSICVVKVNMLHKCMFTTRSERMSANYELFASHIWDIQLAIPCNLTGLEFRGHLRSFLQNGVQQLLLSAT